MENTIALWHIAEINPLTPQFNELPDGNEVSFLPLENIWAYGKADQSSRKVWKKSETSYTQFQNGDILVPKVTPTVYHGRSMIADIDSEIGLATSEVHVIRCKREIEPRWILFNLLSGKFLDEARGAVYGVGGLQRISMQYLQNYKIANYSLGTQRRIADYLDRETEQIDTLVAELDDYVELLEKRNESLLKETIEVLARDFHEVQCKFIVCTTTGTGDTQDANSDGPYPFFVRSDHLERSAEWSFDTEAVLTSGDGAGVGKIYHLANGKFHAHQRVYVMSNFKETIPEYYYWAFKHRFTASIQYGGAKSTVDSVRMNMITDLKIPLPDLDTQKWIADYLDKETAKTDTIITECNELKELLLKRRQVLITDVVTGKVEV
ncbi:restriction endonuclease subunit S [Corynebacterium sp. 153RC1]|uniref:restriction endonuclease subunit S n=1 Tax=unclassified Corynebacterium TaxID=2624378 RepID=UPI00211C1B43|nr:MULTISPECIES: restriction endonuclease subunit S [unclassified Corynebacterium]MCQ9353465.1 restriction endonuclease subunit S [Corynebacterium sp. 209RC1]MCQ9355701.1 restriction endonuclease subunit S [Corynebacterium sp. 1222RC1]MCQ9356775.1 restriction endonuclease subunit S [Corynebacterium sp. 122RC1]MCQ9360069.1 restriction endonuclease subunit S [Corynebacterium sp. 142RC1]MCQ9361129.1 restriction endonuclease subunit S [Corynebacterium sp. 153RC1]